MRVFINVHFAGETVYNPEKFKNYSGAVCESGRSIRGAQNEFGFHTVLRRAFG